MNKTLRAARFYAEKGWPVLPVRGKEPDTRLVLHGVKDATTDEATIERWCIACPNDGVGIAMGNGIIGLDVDPRHGGAESFAELVAEHGPLETLTCETGGGGEHYYFRTSQPVANASGFRPGLELKTSGVYLVAPPSRHPSGGTYAWRTPTRPVAEAPAWLLELATEKSGNGKRAEPIPEVIPDGARHTKLTSLAGTMRRRGMTEGAILAALRETNKQCDPPLNDADLQSIAKNYAGYEPAEQLGKPAYTGEPHGIEAVEEVFKRWLHLPDLRPLHAVLGAVAANQLDGDPVWLGVVAPPSSAKTELLNSLQRVADVYPAATLTPASLLSGTAKKSRAKDAKGGLLREIGDFGIMLLKDFGSVLSMRPEAKAEVLAALRELYDGSWTRHLGTDGGKTLHWSGKLGFVFGCTPAIDSHHGVMSAMGQRFLIVRGEGGDRKQLQRALKHTGKQTEAMRRELAAAVAGLFAAERCEPQPLTEDEQEKLIDFAWDAVRVRSAVERDRHTREVEAIHGTEGPARLGLALERLLAGMDSLGIARDVAWKVVARVAQDSVPPHRRRALDLLRATQPEAFATKDVAESLGLPTTTTRRALEDLAAYGLVSRRSGGGKGSPDVWQATS